MPLTDIVIRNAKPNKKAYKIADEKGLYVLVTNTSKYFRFDFRYGGKRKTLALGVYPDTSLKEARERRDDARKNLSNGVDPCELKKSNKRAKADIAQNTFEAVSREWVVLNSPNWSAGYEMKIINRLEKDIFPLIGDKPISEISAPVLLSLFRRIESRGAIDTAHRAKMNCSQIFRYAIATHRAERDPAADLKGALHPVSRDKHFASITDPKGIGELLRIIDGYKGSYIVKYALMLAPLVFVRPGELRKAEWSEVDFERMDWRIPAEKMKMGAVHIVPLSHQAFKILQNLKSYTGHGKYLFPSIRTESRPMSENTINAALRRLGYTKDEMTGHGFRSMASTNLHEQGWPSDVIERQLAHSERNAVKASYNYAEYLPQRRKMMQSWADYLEGLKGGAKIVPLFSASNG